MNINSKNVRYISYPVRKHAHKLCCVPVAQWLEHCVSNAKVMGSIPREHTDKKKKKKMYSLNAL